MLSSNCPKRSLPSASLLTYTETEVRGQGNIPYPSSSMVTSLCSHPRTSVQISPLCISPTAICIYVSSYDFLDCSKFIAPERFFSPSSAPARHCSSHTPARPDDPKSLSSRSQCNL